MACIRWCETLKGRRLAHLHWRYDLRCVVRRISIPTSSRSETAEARGR